MSVSPVWRRWVAELELLTRVRRTMGGYFYFYDQNDLASRFSVKGVKIFDENGCNFVLKEKHFYVPVKWNHGYFDIIYYYRIVDGLKDLWFINCSTSDFQEFKLSHVATFLKKAGLVDLFRQVLESESEHSQICKVHFVHFTQKN